MEDFTLSVQKRDGLGTTQSRGLRRDGYIPSVIYSQGNAAIPIVLTAREFIRKAQMARPSQVFQFESEDGELKGKSGIVKDIQLHSVSEKVLHVDFQLLHDDREVALPIPLVVQGEAPGVKNQGGILNVLMREVVLACLPKHIPDEIIVDISQLALGERFQAGELDLPEGTRLAGKPNDTVVNIVSGRAARLEEASATEAEAGEAGDAAPAAAEGEAPKEDGGGDS